MAIAALEQAKGASGVTALMRILLDECLPRRLKAHLSGHECRTVPETGWAGKKNGELLELAEDSYDVFLTLDKGIKYQQNLSGRGIAIVVVQAPSNRLEDLIDLVPAEGREILWHPLVWRCNSPAFVRKTAIFSQQQRLMY